MDKSKVTTTKITITLKNSLMEKVEQEAEGLGMNRSAFITLCINQYFKHEEALRLLNQANDLMEQVQQMADAQQVNIWEATE